MLRPLVPICRALLIACVAAGSAHADITVRGTVYYWNGDLRNADDTYGGYDRARRVQVQVENDHETVGDINTWTDAQGNYAVKFKQRTLRPDFDSLEVDVEVRARVLLRTHARTGPDEEIKVECYKGAFRAFPYNGQTSSLEMADGSTWTLNVYVGTGENPDPPETSTANTRNLKIARWDYDDDGRRTVAGIFMCQVCREEDEFLMSRCARASELTRSTVIFYPEDGASYRPGQSPRGMAWIDMGRDGETPYTLFPADHPAGNVWESWRQLRCSMLHEFAHKLMHDVYWTMPKPYPWGEGIDWPWNDDSASQHDLKSCRSEELGWVEGWADFLPAAVLNLPTVAGEPVVVDRMRVPGAPGEPEGTLYTIRRNGNNLEHAWLPPAADVAQQAWALPGEIAWRDELTGRREFNEGEVAAVLWDIYDPAGWEFMPASRQARRPPEWPAYLRWHEPLHDPKLERIWAEIKAEPECLNDETEGENYRDSFWTSWVAQHGRSGTPLGPGPTWLRVHESGLLAHGLKAVLHNRDMRHELLPEHPPEILGVRLNGRIGTVSFVEVRVREPDDEDRRMLRYNLAYARGTEPWKVWLDEDRPLSGPVTGDELRVTIGLPPQDRWDRLILLVHDNMEPAFLANSDSRWDMTTDPATLPRWQIIAAGHHRTTAWKADGSVWTWGYSGPRGNTDDHGRDKSVAEYRLVAGTPILTDRVELPVAVAVGGQHSAAALRDGTVWTWGNNESGALGIDSDQSVIRTPRSTVSQVPGLTDIVTVAAGYNNTLALRADGTVWSWGSNGQGEIGDGTRELRRAPVQVRDLQRIRGIAVGLHGLAVDDVGRVWAWGDNGWGQLADGTTERRLTPIPVLRLPVQAAAVAVNWSGTSFALATDGTVWEWGRRRKPDLWSRSDDTRVPQPVPGLSDITAIAAGSNHALALKRDGTVWAWGDNFDGQLGGQHGDQASRWRVARVEGLTDVIAVAAGTRHSVAVRSDGTVWCWGANTAEALGNAGGGPQYRPGQVQTFERIQPKDLRENSDAFRVFPFRLF